MNSSKTQKLGKRIWATKPSDGEAWDFGSARCYCSLAVIHSSFALAPSAVLNSGVPTPLTPTGLPSAFLPVPPVTGFKLPSIGEEYGRLILSASAREFVFPNSLWSSAPLTLLQRFLKRLGAELAQGICPIRMGITGPVHLLTSFRNKVGT